MGVNTVKVSRYTSTKGFGLGNVVPIFISAPKSLSKKTKDICEYLVENITDKNLTLNNVVGELKNNEIPYGSIFSNEKSLEGQKIDPLVFAGWQTLLLISFFHSVYCINFFNLIFIKYVRH